MFKRFLICLIALITFYAAVDAPAKDTKREKLKKRAKLEKKTSKIVWLNDVKKALAQAKKGKKNILLVHTAPEVNNNSKLFNKNIIQHKSFAKAAAGMVLVKFEYKNMRKLSKESMEAIKSYPIEVQGNKYIMPTVYLLDSSGKILDRKVGYQDRSPASYIKSFRGYKKSKK